MTTTRYSSGIYARKHRVINVDAVVLNARERRLIQLLSDGLQVKEIAWMLDRSVGAVKWGIAELYKKLGVVNRARLVRLAIRKGWVKA